jgi:hypothetical protein
MSHTEGGKQRGSYEKGVFRSVRKTVGFGIRCLACWLVLGLCVFIIYVFFNGDKDDYNVHLEQVRSVLL